MPDLPAFPDARFYSCTDPESLSCTEPDEAIEEYLDGWLAPKMTAAEVLAEVRKHELEVTAYDPVPVEEKMVEGWADDLLERLGERFSEEGLGDPDGEPGGEFPKDAGEVMREAVKGIIRRSHIWSCKAVGKVTLSPDQIEAWVRANRPDWLEEG